MRALVTGASGFAGSHLCEYLLTQPGWEVYALSFPGWPTTHLEPIRAQIVLLSGDLMVAEWVERTLAEIRPDVVFHLAAQSSPSASLVDPAGTLVNNIVAQVNLFQAILKARLDPVVLVVGSGDEYGLVRPDEVPVDEDTPLRPANPYAVSKIAQDFLGLQYFLSHRLRAVRVRPFNHIGPRQAPVFVTADWAQQIAEIEAGLRPPIVRVGNLQARRDFTDVRDMVRAYHLAVTLGEPGEVYNLGSGRAYPVREVLNALLAMSRVPVQVEVDPQRLRPSDIPVIACDSTRFRRRTGWEPRIPLEDSLRDILDYWRGQVRARSGARSEG